MKTWRTAALGLCFACVSWHAWAEPADYVYTPLVTAGEKEIDFKMGTSSTRNQPTESAASLGLGYGVNSWWFTEFYAKYKRELNQDTRFDAWEWENKFQLTEQGQYPVDVGFLVEIERPIDTTEGWELKWGPLFQAEKGKWQFNANFLFQRYFSAAVPTNYQFLYQWQVKYRWTERLEYGMQGFGELGDADNWTPPDQQTHRMGPAVFGRLPLGQGHALRYNAAWLIGSAPAAPDNTLRLQVEYEFP